MVSGEELFRRYQEGDRGAFDDLVALYEHDFMFFLNGVVNDKHEATHLMIEAFAQLALKGGDFSGRSSLKTYLYTIGKNLAFRYVKARRKERHISIEEIAGGLHDVSESPESSLEREESHLMLRKAMQDLKAEHKAVLLLLYFEDMSYIEAGQALRKSEMQIRSLAHRAKEALKKKLQENGAAN